MTWFVGVYCTNCRHDFEASFGPDRPPRAGRTYTARCPYCHLPVCLTSAYVASRPDCPAGTPPANPLFDDVPGRPGRVGAGSAKGEGPGPGR